MADNPLDELSADQQKALAKMAQERVEGRVGRRDLLKAGGILSLGGLIGGGAGAAATQSAKADPQGNLGTESDPWQNAYLQSASIGEARITTGGTMTINVPSDYPTVADAVDAAYQLVPNGGLEITINIESGHEWGENVVIEGKNLAHVTITSEDATVYSVSGWQGYALMQVSRGSVAPTWDVLVDGRGDVQRGVWISRSSKGYVTANSGVLGVTNAALIVNRLAFVWCEDPTRWGDSDRGINVTQTSGVVARGADVTGNTSYGMRAGGGSTIDATFSDPSGCQVGYRATSTAKIVANQASIDGCSNRTVSVMGGQVYIKDTSITNTGGVGVNVREGGGVIANNATITGSTNEDINIGTGSTVTAHDVTTTNSSDGTPEVGDTNVSSFNSITADGIIFAN